MKKLFSKLMLVAMAATTFVACEDVPEPYSIPEATPAEEITYTGSGTLENPYTCADVIKYVQSLDGEESAVEVYVKGIVAEITEEFTTQYGNGTFTISDDGKTANVFTAYRVLYLGNQRYSSGKMQIKEGDEVIVYGKVVNYRGNTPETVQGSAFLYSLNGVSEGGTSTVEGEPTGTGTLEDPFNSVAAIKYAQELGETESPKEVYIKGKVASITEQYGTQYGNATFTISDDGSANGAFTVYRALYLGNQKYTSGDLLKEGDDVIVCGKVVNYRGNTPETVQGSAYLYSLNGVTGGNVTPQPSGEATGSGTLADPFNYVAAVKFAQQTGENESDDVYIKGKVATITEQYGTQYGNATFTITDDGKTASETFTVYRALYLGNQKYTSGDLLKEGDDVIICGKVTNFRGNTPETVTGKAYLYSLNGKTEGGGTTPEPQPGGDAKGSGTEADPFNVQAIINFVSALGADVDTKADYYVKGIVTSIPNNGISTQYNNVSFYISDDKGASNSFYVFRAKGLGGGDVTENMIKVGDEVVIFGSTWVNYRGNTPETKQGEAYVVSVTPGEGGGGGNPNGGEVSSNSITVDFSTMGFENAQDINTINLSDGTTLTFSAGDNKNGPKYYNSGTSIRMYPQNNFTASAGKNIASIVLTCSANNAEGNVTASPGSVSTSDMTVTISGVNSKSTTVTNAHTGTGATSQLRISSLKITYAE